MRMFEKKILRIIFGPKKEDDEKLAFY